MRSTADISDPAASPQATAWFAASAGNDGAEALGFRSAPGGVHLSKTMMLAELATILDRLPASEAAEVERAIVVDNLLGKPTGSARRLALARLNTLYGILTPRPVQLAALRLWPRNVAGRPVLALLCALAREPLLRQSARPVLDAHPGTSVRWPELASAILAEYLDRYSPKMLKSLAQNCISSWTQSGHLQGRVNKRRRLGGPLHRKLPPTRLSWGLWPASAGRLFSDRPGCAYWIERKPIFYRFSAAPNRPDWPGSGWAAGSRLFNALSLAGLSPICNI